ncbi:excalibur calcium-binding domain-containing protein [Aliiglaciecola sp. SL4]|uniref:excalibur calcium-binding domain-containing protein n=1 Tax=Aliiglaciecola sp. SL4 TaxID=3239806 RepID=UPI00355BD605
MYRGKLTNWNDDKGFGFIKADGLTRDTFIHISELKHMSRKPRMGDYINFEIANTNGKSRAIKASIEGVGAIPKPSFKRNNKKQFKLRFSYILILISFGILAIKHFQEPAKSTSQSTIISWPTFTETESKQNFSCDGRQHCSQMTSRAEAEYFLRNCPNTKMDGDRDGIPCERQRF